MPEPKGAEPCTAAARKGPQGRERDHPAQLRFLHGTRPTRPRKPQKFGNSLSAQELRGTFFSLSSPLTSVPHLRATPPPRHDSPPCASSRARRPSELTHGDSPHCAQAALTLPARPPDSSFPPGGNGPGLSTVEKRALRAETQPYRLYKYAPVDGGEHGRPDTPRSQRPGRQSRPTLPLSERTVNSDSSLHLPPKRQKPTA